MKLVFISDTHTKLPDNIPDGDLLIHSGDYGFLPKKFFVEQKEEHLEAMWKELDEFNESLMSIKSKFREILYIPGNHDFIFQIAPEDAAQRLFCATTLNNKEWVFNNLHFYGTAAQPIYKDWAFNFPENELRQYFSQIPKNCEILITHTPPYGILDKAVLPFENHAGCQVLLESLKELTHLKIHAFGHIHEEYGVLNKDNITFVNASSLDETYKKPNLPIVLEI